jgi:CDP-4-dehydro-6-deoxyglucose reductase
MAYQVTLQPSGHQFSVVDDKTLLEAGLDAGLNLPYGCKNGACGACKGKVLSGTVDHGAAQDHALPAGERTAGLALLCCAKPATDVVLEVREVSAAKDIPVKTMPCRVQSLERAAPDVMVLKLKLPTNERLQFLAGQYIEFLLADGKRRAFSLANAPHADDLLELHIRHVAGGNFTDHVFKTMKVKDILRIEGHTATRGVVAPATADALGMNHIFVRVIDDGCGFDPVVGTRNGLGAMRERAVSIGATVSIVSKPGRTVVEIKLPG